MASTTKKGSLLWHIVAITVAIVWGTTFVSSKMLINAGMTPAEIMCVRFIIAYICLLPISIRGCIKDGRGLRGLFCDNLKDEFGMLLLGITGGSLYFLFENSALEYTQASNVSIIICTTPLLTMLATSFLARKGNGKSISTKTYLYSAIALLGVVVVVLNGELVLKLHPLGDILTFGASTVWVIYSILLPKLDSRYPTDMITRKVFIYGVLTMLPVFIFRPWATPASVLVQPGVAGNLLFLGLMASFAGYFGWNAALSKIGAVRANNYLYLNPLATAVIAIPVLHERFTWIAGIGAILIISGMALASRESNKMDQGV